jgi:phosphoglycolate phosphatase
MDFNGVIINDEPLHFKAYQQILAGDGINITEEDYYRCTGMDDRSFVREQYRIAGKELNDEKIRDISMQKTTVWRSLVDKEIPLFENVENFIRKSEKRFALCIVSMAKREEIEHVLDHSRLTDCFSSIISAEDVSHHKPNPECYIKGFQKLDTMRSGQGHYPLVHRECLVIEDTPQGVQAGKKAGMKVLAVTNTFDEKILREAGADSVTKDLNDWMPESLAQVF